MITTQVCVSPVGVAAFLLGLLDPASDCVAMMNQLVVPINISFFIYLKYFLVTIILEAPIYFLCLRPIPIKVFLPLVIGINLATHPFIFLVLPRWIAPYHASYIDYLLVAEVFTPLVELILIKYFLQLTWRHSVLAAIVANLFSWCVGVFLL